MVVYELRDKAGTLVSTGEVEVIDDGLGGWTYRLPEAIRDLPAADYVFSIGDLGISLAIINPNYMP